MDAAELGRRSVITLRDRVHRVRLSLGLAVQAAVAAGIAWYIAHELLGHIQPFFAPISAVVVLAISVGHRLRRAIELVIGNAIGILLAEMLLLIIGRGVWQLSLIVMLAILVAIFAGGSASLVSQAASSATLVMTFIPSDGDYFFSRVVDAIVGGGVGLAVMALLLPLNPLTVVGRAANKILSELAEGLTDAASALDGADEASVQTALSRLRDAEGQLRSFDDAIAAGREISTFAPLHWRKRGALTQYVDAYNHVARALRGSRVLVRRARVMLEDGETVPPSLAVAIRELALAVDWLRKELAEVEEPTNSRAAVVQAVRAAAQAYAVGVGFSGSVVVAQVRSTGADLLRAGGMPDAEANRLIRRAARTVP